jgi:hypothetical protein
VKYFLLLVIIAISVRHVAAQEPVRTAALPKDSVISGIKPEAAASLMSQPPLFTTELNFDLSELPVFTPKITVPLFDLSVYQRNKWQVITSPGHELGFMLSGPFFTPGWGTLFNQAVYRASDKLYIGGSSFGVNSILHAPLPASKGSNYDFRGVSMFLEYKVSDNFRIGGGVTVAGHPKQP